MGDVGCGMWDVGWAMWAMWDVGCGMGDVGWAMWERGDWERGDMEMGRHGEGGGWNLALGTLNIIPLL